ncbi:MAG: hypothetical protein BIFFINMI_02478 [Phycisphaerae bacterium]|nr:hypothetical protein [Phycisphaerae bacterium]
MGQGAWEVRIRMKKAGYFVLALMAAGLLAAVPPTPASADSITLVNGTTYQGKIIERTDDHVVLQVEDSGISARLPFEWSKIAKLTESPPARDQIDDLLQQRLADAEQKNTSEGFTQLGQWLQDSKLFDEAIRAYEKALKLDPDDPASLSLSIAQCIAGRGDLREARATLKDLVGKYPDNKKIASELARLDNQAQKRVDDMIALALANYKKNDMRSAISLMERMQRLNIDELTEKADYATMHQAGMSFAHFLAECRLHQACATCGGHGMQLGLSPCPTCKGTGKVTRTRWVTVTEKDAKGVERKKSWQEDYEVVCPGCHGFTSVLCPACHGAGVDLGTVGPVERDELAEGLAKRIEAVYAKLKGYADEPSSLHPANLEIVQLQTTRLAYYIEQYLKLRDDLKGKPLQDLVTMEGKVRNLLAHTSAAYANRDLKKFEQILAKRLELMIQRDGLLWPEDFEFKEPSAVSGTMKPALPAPNNP